MNLIYSQVEVSVTLMQVHSCTAVRSFFTSLNSLVIMLVTSSFSSLVTKLATSSSVEAPLPPHDSISSIVDCASESDDNRIIGRQITTATKARLYDLDMLLHCSV